MKSGKCPKCGSSTVYTKRLGVSMGDGGVHVYTSQMISKAVRELDHYLCTTCGYFETYVEDKAKLEQVTKDWKRVG